MRRQPRVHVRHLAPGTTLAGQGEPEDELFLLLDGILTAEVDGRALAELGPGSILGERALFARGTRTATLRAKTSCRVAVVHVHDLQEYVLAN